MAQVESGLRSILSSPRVYRLSQALVGMRRVYQRLVGGRLKAGDCMLDIGCGTGDVLEAVPGGVAYYGFDLSARYIDYARRRFGERGTFWAEPVDAATVARLPACDLVLACGVLHHLDDDEAEALLRIALSTLKPDGVLITYDPCFTPDMGRLERSLVSRDRGQNVRAPEGYETLCSGFFSDVSWEVLSGHLRIPYRSVIMRSAG